MIENSMIKSIGLLAIITVGVFIGTHEVAEFFLKEKEHRKYWLKVWLTISVIISIILWVILIFWGK